MDRTWHLTDLLFDCLEPLNRCLRLSEVVEENHQHLCLAVQFLSHLCSFPLKLGLKNTGPCNFFIIFYKEKNHSLGFQLFTKFGDILPEAAAIAMAAMSNTFVPTLATAIKADPKVVGGQDHNMSQQQQQ